MNKFIQKISIGIIILLFTGCYSVILPALKTFSLSVTEDCCKSNKKRQNLTIKILEPVTNKHLNNVSLYYSKDKYLLQTYKLSKWSDYPVKMILQEVSSKLDQLGIYDNIITSHIYSNFNYILQSELLDFKQNINDKESYIRLRIKFYLIKNNRKKRVVSRTFNYKIKCNSIDAYGSVEAYNKSINLLINDLSSWLYKNTKVQ
jgi:ABC-type uncharacterized transport system auxiliary subunit